MYWQSILAGALSGWGFNAFNTELLYLKFWAPFATLLGFCVLGFILRNAKKPLMSSYLFGVAYHTVSLFWVGSAFDYTTVPFLKSFVSVVGGAYLAGQFPLSVWLTERIAQYCHARESGNPENLAAPLGSRFRGNDTLLLWSVVFSLLDLLHITNPIFFPWNPMGFIAGEFCLSSVRWFGIFGLSFIMLLFSQLPYLSNKWRIGMSMIVGLLILDHHYFQQQPTPYTNIYGRIVQPCIGQDFKWQMDKFEAHVQKFRDLSRTSSSKPLRFILWPESALPVYQTEEVEELVHLVPEGTPLIVGHVHMTRSCHPGNQKNDTSVYTSLSALHPQKGMVATYKKRHLVPFGEYIPIPLIHYIIPLITQQKMEMVPGNKYQTLDLAAINLPNAHALICYESVFPQTIYNYQQWIIGVSNDAWFGTSSGPYQHLRWNQIRCLENNMPMVRSTNHGISAFIDSQGRLKTWLPLNQCGVIDHFVPASSGPSLYNQYGTWVLILLYSLLFLVCYIGRSISCPFNDTTNTSSPGGSQRKRS